MKKKSILIIMKKDDYLLQLIENLQANDFNVIVMEKGKDGFEAARKNRPDIIVTSYNLNGLDGIDLCYMIKNSAKLASTPFVIISNYMNRQERIDAYRYGVDAIVSSSISQQELIVQIESLILNYKLLTKKSQDPAQSLAGKLNDFKLIEILQMLNMSQKTGVLTIFHDFKDGQIALENGEITFALFENLMGEQAIQKMVTWENGSFIFEKDTVETESNVNKPTMQLILDCCQMLDESSFQINLE